MTIAARLERLGPVRIAFLGSLLLSLIARQTSDILNRDGMLYVQVARGALERGVVEGFDWQLLPLLIAAVSYVTRLEPELAAHFIDALFMAGTCALMVDLVRKRMPEIAWSACLVVLAMPAFNGYRDFLIREFGYWFFSVLSFWMAQRWEDRGYRWREAIYCQLALAGAILFRLEAAVFYGALIAWQLFAAPVGLKVRRTFMIGCLPLVGGLVLAVLVVSGAVKPPARMLGYLTAANLLERSKLFRQASDGLSTFLPKFSKADAGTILLIGMLSLIPIKFVKMCGVFVVPLIHAFFVRNRGVALTAWPLLTWAFTAHFMALFAFAGSQLFVSGRYVTMLNLLVVPVVAQGLAMLWIQRPRWRWPLLLLALVTLLANVVSLSNGNAHYKAAGAWLLSNVVNSERVYVQDQRIAYYAGWPYAHGRPDSIDRECLEQALLNQEFDMLVLTQKKKDSGIDSWVQANRLQVVQQFFDKKGDAVIIVTPAARRGGK